MEGFAAELSHLVGNKGSVLAVGQHVVHAILHRPLANTTMGILTNLAQLQHIGQHGNGAALAMVGLLGFRQGFKRRLHGSGAGVISVVDKGNIANINYLLAATSEASCS